jgi:hypothetical protein
LQYQQFGSSLLESILLIRRGIIEAGNLNGAVSSEVLMPRLALALRTFRVPTADGGFAWVVRGLGLLLWVGATTLGQDTKPGTVRGYQGMDAGALMQKVVDALGGDAVLARVKSTKYISVRHAKTPHGEATIEVEQISVFPDRIYMATTLPQGRAITVLSPEDGFMATPSGIVEISAKTREKAATTIALGIIFAAQHMNDPLYGFSLKGSENIGDLVTAVLEITCKDDKTTWNIDPATGRVLRATRMMPGFNGTPTLTRYEYSDWRQVNGVSVPFRISEDGAISAVDDVRSVELNPLTPSNLFERPSASDRSSVGSSPTTQASSSTSPVSTNAKSGISQTVGGKWTYELSEDKLTEVPYRLFVLKADGRMTDGIGSDFPSFVILCGGPEDSPGWINSKFLSPVVLGAGDQKSALGVPQQSVHLRADRKIRLHFWNIADDYRTLFVDKGATRELINSSDARIAFHDAAGHVQVADFSPAGLDRDALAKACGGVFK